MHRLLCALVLVLPRSAPETARAAPVALGAPEAAAPAASPQKRRGKRGRKPPLPSVPAAFLRDLAAARELARERNVALLVAVIQDGEEANQRFFEGVYRTPAFVELTAGALVLAVNDGEHEQRLLKEEREDGEIVERSVCSWFETPRCAAHQRNWTRVYLAFNQDGEMRTPQLLVLAPDGELRQRFIDVHRVSGIAALLKRITKEFGPGVTGEELVRIKRHRGAAATFAGDRRWPRAWAEWTAILAVTEHGPFAREAREGVERALGAMRAAVAAALERMEAGEIVAGYEALLELEESYGPTPVARELARAIKGAERNPAWRDALRARKRALAAEKLWREVEELLRSDREDRARAVARRILLRYGDTPAAERARKEFPDLESDAALSAAGGGRPRSARRCRPRRGPRPPGRRDRGAPPGKRPARR